MAVKIIGLIIGILVLCAGLYYLIKFRKHQATAAERPKKQKELRQNTSTLNICRQSDCQRYGSRFAHLQPSLYYPNMC